MSDVRRRLGVIGQIGGGGVAITGALGFVREVLANEVSALGQWVITGVVIFGLLLWIVSWFLKQRPVGESTDDRAAEVVVPPMPQAAELIGRDREIGWATAGARSHGLVLVHGPDGIGAGSVAISAAEALVPDPARRRYVDLYALRADDAHGARIQVLRTLGVAPSFFEGRSANQCAEMAVHALQAADGETVLVVDNVTGARQVDWIRGVNGAYVIIAGDFPADLVRASAADVAVQGLEMEDAFTLLRKQDSDAIPVRRRWRLSWRPLAAKPVVGGGNSIARRIAAEPVPARELAEVYLKHPRVVIALGRWLARNRHVGFTDLLGDLDRHTENFELQVILRKQLDGASPGARRLLALLARAPEAEYTDRAIAAMTRLPVERTSGYLGELTARFIVEQTSSRYRLAAQAAQLAEVPRPRAAASAAVRLASYFAELAAASADDLLGDRTGDWFKAEDATLRQVLGTAGQPKQAGPHLCGSPTRSSSGSPGSSGSATGRRSPRR